METRSQAELGQERRLRHPNAGRCPASRIQYRREGHKLYPALENQRIVLDGLKGKENVTSFAIGQRAKDYGSNCISDQLDGRFQDQ